jgi:DNA-directed RNA polymerase specialized sigma subunit
MPAKNFLNPETKEKLQKALKEHEHPDIRERVLMLLLLDDGNTQKHIAELIGCSLSKVVEVHGAKAEEKVELHQNEPPRQIQPENQEYYALADSGKIQQ